MDNERKAARRRTGVTVAATATALAVAALTGPAANAGPQRHDTEPQADRSQPAGQARDDVVTLVTGDRVRVSDGRPGSIALLPGSPSYGTQPLIFGSGEAMYVIPRMGTRARDRLDYSMFDVTALADARRGGRVPLEVRFERGVQAHDVAGIDVDEAAVRRTSAGSYVADASYVAGAASADPASWQGVADVRLAQAPNRTTGPARGRKRTLRIRVENRAGDPIKRADAWVQNLDDGKRFNKAVKVKHGKAAVSVPKGNYSVMAFHRAYLVGDPELELNHDRTVRLDLADATVGYEVAVAGAHENKGPFGDMLVQRRSEKHGAFRIVGDRTARLQPMPGPFAHGSLRTQVAGYFKRGDRKGPPNVFTMDLAKGIPADLTFHHDRSDFARIPYRIHSDGAPRQGRGFGTLIRAGVTGHGRGMPALTGWDRVVDTPARYTFWLQAGAHWAQALMVFDDSNGLEMHHAGRYEPGRLEPVHQLRGPVGPGVERGIDGDRTGRHCLLCRDGKLLRGRLPLLSGAGMGYARTLASRGLGSWQLRHKKKVLQRGHSLIRPRLALPAKERRYTLRATSRLGKLGWRLSPRVVTSWGFASRKGTGVVPLLMPSYVPPATLKGPAEPGPMTYRLDLENLGPVASRITKASLRYSTNDGKSWHRARLRRLDDNSFEVRYRNPAAKDEPRFVSVRVKAEDAGGRTVKETAMRVYRLRNS